MSRVLVVEDDAEIRRALVRSLTDHGHAVASADSGLSGLREAVDGEPDVVLLDLGLPDLDGTEVLAMLRAVRPTPVIVITAREDDPSVIGALDAGADDYVVKPFTGALIDARIRAVLRRSGEPERDPRIVVGELVIDPRSREVALGGRPLELSRREFDLLAYLAGRSGEVVAKREILADVWRQAYGGGDRSVDVHLSWLRRKLGETAAEPVYLHSVRGVGVRLAPPVEG